jgi:hypothetical protein
MIVPGECPERAADVVLVAKRQRRQVQARRPAFGLLRERLHGREVEFDSSEPKQGRSLRRAHGQVLGADFDELTLGSQARDRQHRLGSRCQRDLRTRTDLGQQRGHQLLEGMCRQRLGVVDHEHRRQFRRV